jgi:hypothetical protein
MKKFFLILHLSLFLLLGLCCGKKGDILPPLVRFPHTAADVRVAQKADQIILTWLNPTAYEDGSTLSVIEKIEIWVLEKEADEEVGIAEIPIEEFEKTAMLHEIITDDQIQESAAREEALQGRMVYPYKLSGEDYLSKKYTFGIRVRDKKRYSRFSALVSLEPIVLPVPPTQVAAVAFSDRIEISWNPPLENTDQSSPANVKGYNIYRALDEGELQRLNARLIEREKYRDRNFGFGQAYRYIVRASATDTSPYLESEDSEEATVLAEDTFAPETPKGLISVAGQDFLSISWDANEEKDLEGYRVWRRDEGAKKFLLLTSDPIKENAYYDRAVEKGKTYAYAVTALDMSGNESEKSEVISDRIRERMR